MSYPEQQMQSYIEYGLSEADRCYNRIAELEAQVNILTNRVKDLEGAEVFAEKWEDEHDAEVARKAYNQCAKDFNIERSYCNGWASYQMADFYANKIETQHLKQKTKGDKQ